MKLHPNLLFKIESTIEREWQGPEELYSWGSLQLSTLLSIHPRTSTNFLRLGDDFKMHYKRIASPLQFEILRRSPAMKYLL